MSTPLIYLETTNLIIEVSGPNRSPSGLASDPVGNAHTVPHFSIKTLGNEQLVRCRWKTPNKQWRDWAPGDPGPLFYEETSYRLVVEGKGGKVPKLSHRDTRLISDVSPLNRNPHILTGNVNFRRQVGRSTFVVSIAESVTLSLTMEVFPSKLDYVADYQAILGEITRISTGLAMEYLRATYSMGTMVEEEGPTKLEWLSILRSQVDELEKALAYVQEHPVCVLTRELGFQKAEKVRRLGPTAIAGIARGCGRGSWLPLGNKGSPLSRIRSSIYVDLVRETLDTPEHRWIRHSLRGVLRGLAEASSFLQVEATQLRRAGRSLLRVRQELSEIQNMESRVSRLLFLRVLQDSDGPIPPHFSSLSLMRQPGYRETFRTLLSLQLGLSVEGEAVELTLKELDRLYEIWCFIRIVHLVTARSASAIDLRDVIAIGNRGIRVSLRQGSHSTISLVAGARTLNIIYNPRYRGLTGEQKPDIVLEIQEDKWPPMYVVFDAKYRVDATDKFSRAFGGPGPPVAAVNVLHRYRDAITLAVEEQGLGRPVVMGVALFPLSESASMEFKQHRFAEALATLGIGALPFLPGNTQLVEEWLETVLDSTPESLAESGPPFLALEHNRSQT